MQQYVVWRYIISNIHRQTRFHIGCSPGTREESALFFSCRLEYSHQFANVANVAEVVA